MQWEAHVRTTIVDSKDFSLLEEDCDGRRPTLHNLYTQFFQFFKCLNSNQ